MTAHGLAVHGPRGPVFEGVDLEVPPGGLLVVHGPGGSGRTSLLLALAGRMRITAGGVQVGRHRLPGRRRDAAAVRAAAAVARAEPAVALEGRLTVAEHIAERTWLHPGTTRAQVAEALALTGTDPDPAALTEDLPPADRVLLAVALTLAQAPAVLVVDDLTRDCPPTDHDRIRQALRRVAGTGCTVLAADTAPPPSGPHLAPALPLPRAHYLPEAAGGEAA
ncbi:ATP-binding cassette domain-containing protein [Streptomyces sp. NRRL B-24484]|uniref:ATP-binding cassette domain-containing protein n=1 Tax=Streptomyces sp. NRRL B-24484 TaxID=1463833 RepID=UPI000ACD42D0|nr:ATP-binding cassette domain-containing protein [Streptomyces sp. NRRL B-24484]